MSEAKVSSLTESVRRSIKAIEAAATQWLDIDFPPRVEAEEATLSCDNRFTQEALVFAINQQMSLLDQKTLTTWAKDFRATRDSKVGVLNPGNVPLAGLQDLIAVILSGHSYVGCVSSKSPHLLPAFAESLLQAGLDHEIVFSSFTELINRVDALVCSGTDETIDSVMKAATAAGIDWERMLLRGHRFSVAVLDGSEESSDYERLAEDILLHEGLGCRSISMIWVPSGSEPDPLLEAMALFRTAFPVHPEMPKSLKMQQAYLEATHQSHAFGEHLEFLLSRGAPDVQSPLHLRWTEYENLEHVAAWIERHRTALQIVVAKKHLRMRLPGGVDYISPGYAQRPELGWIQDEQSVTSFLNGL